MRLVLHAFPLDPDLPGLVHATDPLRLVEMLGPVLTSSVAGLALQDCHAELVRYGRRGGCVLRYGLIWRLQPSRRTVKQVVYGKVYPDDRGSVVGPAVTALRQHVQAGSGRFFPFLVPRFQAYLPDLRLALLDALPGTPQLPALIRERAAGGTATISRGLTAEGALDTCARVTVALHESAVPVGEPRTLAGEIGQVRREVEAVAQLAPALAALLHEGLTGAAGVSRDAPAPLGVAHGDLTPSQVLFDGPLSGLVSFDAVCLAEPALDLGSLRRSPCRRDPEGRGGGPAGLAIWATSRVRPSWRAMRAFEPATTRTCCSPASLRTGP